MARTIFKYPLSNTYGVHTILAPPDLVPLTIQLQRGMPCLWAEINQRVPAISVVVRVYGTGYDLPDSPGKYIGTWQDDVGLVYHAYLLA